MSLEKGILAAEENLHSASGKWEVHIGPVCINQLSVDFASGLGSNKWSITSHLVKGGD